jgi:cytoskeletal protein CcmA (bactofilin family)
MFNKSSKPQNRIDSLIGATTRIDGNVTFSGGIRLDGVINGNVSAEPDQAAVLVLSEHARIDGEVKASHLVVNGAINGPVHASETIELQSNARIRGDVHYKSMEMQLGAVVEGRLVHVALASEVRPVELKLAAGGTPNPR